MSYPTDILNQALSPIVTFARTKEGSTIRLDLQEDTGFDRLKTRLIKDDQSMTLTLMRETEEVLTVQFDMQLNVLINSEQHVYELTRKSKFSREITITKDQQLFVTSEVESRTEGKFLLITHDTGEDQLVAFTLMYAVHYGMMIR